MDADAAKVIFRKQPLDEGGCLGIVEVPLDAPVAGRPDLLAGLIKPLVRELPLAERRGEEVRIVALGLDHRAVRLAAVVLVHPAGGHVVR